jgi:hypothetical protein
MTTIAVLGAVAALLESAGGAPGILAVVPATMARVPRTAGNLVVHLHG